MGSVIGDVLPLAVGIAVSPIPIIAAILMLLSPRARGTSVCMTFGQYGEPPLSPAIPTLVADFVDAYVRGADGKWRFKERHIHRIFVAPDNSGPLGPKK